MIDALGVEFALVSDLALFEKNKKKWFGDISKPNSCPGDSWGGEDHHNDDGHH